MADEQSGRDKQARDTDERQREYDLALDLDRVEEPEPSDEEATLDRIDRELREIDFPATGNEVVDAVGDRSVDDTRVETLFAESERFRSPARIRVRIRRPTVARAMKRIVEASQQLQDVDFELRRDTYERTFRELESIEADDENEGTTVIAEWVLDRIETEERLPSSRAVRKRAAEFCRANDYPIDDDSWLGV